MELPKTLDNLIEQNVSLEQKEKIFERIKTPEGFRKWQLERLKEKTGIEFEDIEIDGTIYRFEKGDKK